MFRLAPDEFTPLGKLGVYIEIMGIKTFLHCQLAEDIACTPHGQLFADEFVFNIVKISYPNIFNFNNVYGK